MTEQAATMLEGLAIKSKLEAKLRPVVAMMKQLGVASFMLQVDGVNLSGHVQPMPDQIKRVLAEKDDCIYVASGDREPGEGE